MDAIVLKAGEGAALSLGGVRMVVKEDGSHTRGTLGLAEFEVPAHGHNTPPPHVHYAHEEGFYILEGELEFQVGADTLRVGPGAFVMVPIGVAHTFSNPTDRPARFLNTFTQPQTRTETFADGLTLRFDERGSGQPVLVLHGGAGPQSVTGFAAALAARARVITPTHPGFGGAPRPEWFDSVADLAHAYLELLERLDLHAVTVIGFSIGGWIASEMAARDSSRLSHLILVDAAGIQVEGQTIADVFSITPDQLSALSFHNPAAFRVDPATLSPAQVAGRAANFQALAAYTRQQGMADPKLRRRLGRVTIPALVIWGESDGVVSPEYGRAYARAFPQARFELIPQASHMAQLEQPERLLQLVGEFI